MGISSSNLRHAHPRPQPLIVNRPVANPSGHNTLPRHLQQQTVTIVRNAYPAQYRQGAEQHPYPLADTLHNLVKEGENIKQLVTCDSKSVRYDPNLFTLSFKLSSNISSFSYEIHTGVKECVRDGKVTFTPNRSKAPPVVYKVENEIDGMEMVLVLDDEVGKMHVLELVYDPKYSLHYPCVICCRWKDETSGEEAAEYTYINLGSPNIVGEGDIPVQTKERTKRPGYVHKQFLSIDGSVYLVERLFGADQEDDHDGNDNVAVVIGVVDNGNNIETTPAQSPANGQTELIDDNDDDGLCVICISEPKDTCVLPCRHLCLCKGCAGELQKHTPKCPVCRMPFNTLLHKGG